MFHKRIILSLISLFLCCFDLAAQNGVLDGNRIEIEVGTAKSQLKWENFSENDWRVSILCFLVGGSGQLYLGEADTNKIKVFDSSGKFLRAFSANDAFSVFLHKATLYGIRRLGVEKAEEIIAFSGIDGNVLYIKRLPFQGPLWMAYEMEDGKLFFSSEAFGKGEIRFYDAEKQIFSAYNGFKQYRNSDQDDVCKYYITQRYEKIGRIDDYLLFRDAKCADDSNPCSYRVIAGTKKEGQIKELTLSLTEDKIGYLMPDIPWIIVKNRYLYTIGYPRKGTHPLKKIFVTCIDLQIALPDIFTDTVYNAP